MPMSTRRMVKEVEEARAAWKLIMNFEKRHEGGRDGTRLLGEPPLAEHFQLLKLFFLPPARKGLDPTYVIEHLGFGKLAEIAIEHGLPPELREHAWISMAGFLGAFGPEQDPYIRAALGEDWKQRLLEELPAAVRLAFNESKPGEIPLSDRIGKGTSLISRTRRHLRKTGDEAAEKPKRVTSSRLEPEETELALLTQQEGQRASFAPEEDFFDYLSGLKPQQGGETHRVVVGTANITRTRWLDEVKAKIPFTKQEARIFDLLRETPNRHEIARRLGIKPESVTRIKTRIKNKVQAYLPIVVS